MNHYVKPGKPTNVFNETVAWLARHGVSILGSRLLIVPGRKSGQPRSNPVNLLPIDGQRYLVSPRGETQWVRNLRAADHTGQLRLGRRVETFHAIELTDDEKPPVLRVYLRRWKFEVGMFFGGVSAKSSEEELRHIAAKHPVFRIEPARSTLAE